MNLKEALKAAIDGKKIRHKAWDDEDYCFWNGSAFLRQDQQMWFAPLHAELAESENWEIVHEPVKYSVELLFSHEPKIDLMSTNLPRFVFGEYGSWSTDQTEGRKKYRVTVEEVPDAE